MTRARRELVSLESTPYYHVISRCVRRAFLWGEDSFTGKNYEHRKSWVLERMRVWDSVFAIDICAYEKKVVDVLVEINNILLMLSLLMLMFL